MLLETIGKANAPRTLSALDALGGTARFTDIRQTTGLSDSQTSRALKHLNKQGLVVGKPQPDRSMLYGMTRAGKETLALIREFHGVVHGRKDAVGKEADKEFEAILVAA